MNVDIQNGILVIDGTEIDNPSFQNLEFIKKLGEGANGFTLLVRHKVLDINQVIKIYKSSDTLGIEKGIEESKKNSEPVLKEVIARVYDAGKIKIGTEEKVYSIMDFIGSSLTLKDWLARRDCIYRKIKDDTEHPGRITSLGEYFIQESIDTSVSFLNSIAQLMSNDITHGDLNENNIFIRSLDYSTDNSIMGCYIPGTLNSSNIQVYFIDLGTSKIAGTDHNFGRKRDSYYIFETVRKLMKPLFQNTGKKSIKTFFNVKIKDNTIVETISGMENLVLPETVASELMRFLMFTNLILNLNSIDGNDFSLLNSIKSSKGSRDVASKGADIFDTDVQKTYNYYMSIQEQASGRLIKWGEYINFIESSFNSCSAKQFKKMRSKNNDRTLFTP